MPLRVLFCTPTSSLSGGLKIIFELINRLVRRGVTADLFSFADAPRWFPLNTRVLPEKNLEEVDLSVYDFVFVSNAFMVPMALRQTRHPGIVFFCQDYESFHHGRGGLNYADYMRVSPTFDRIYRLPVPIIAISRSIQQLVKDRAGRDAYFMPLGIDQTVFRPQPRNPHSGAYRILMVGNYLIAHKGMRDGLKALGQLSREHPAQLVLITQENRNREMLAQCGCPIEVHYCCPPESVAAVMAGCDAYCCASWYEGFGLPAVEAFHCGLPVVSTQTLGVTDYGVDGVNLRLARPNDPGDLCEKLKQVILNPDLQQKLIKGGFATAQSGFDWETSVDTFLALLKEIRNSGSVPKVDPAELDRLLRDLEQEGSLTPIAVFREFRWLTHELDELCAFAISRAEFSAAATKRLAELRDQFDKHLGNPQAQYYDAFRQKYDFCRLVLSLQDSARCVEYLQLIQDRGRGNGRRSPSTLVEVRYTNA
jgi:glycosyltransferase involved in cell wall biosynthesis